MSNFVCILQVIVLHDVSILMNLGLFIFLYRSTKKNSYTLQPMEPNSLKCSSMQTVHSIELKFGMYFIGHRLAHCIDFSEFKNESV